MGHHLDQLIRNDLGVQVVQADPVEVHFAQLPQQTGQGSSVLQVQAVPGDVLRNNDQVVTTGSTVYPKGLILGYVEVAGFDETGVAKYAMLRPAADLEDLEQVFVITDYVSE